MLPCGTPKLLSWVDKSYHQFVRIVVVLKHSSELTLRLRWKSSFYKVFEAN